MTSATRAEKTGGALSGRLAEKARIVADVRARVEASLADLSAAAEGCLRAGMTLYILCGPAPAPIGAARRRALEAAIEASGTGAAGLRRALALLRRPGGIVGLLARTDASGVYMFRVAAQGAGPAGARGHPATLAASRRVDVFVLCNGALEPCGGWWSRPKGATEPYT